MISIWRKEVVGALVYFRAFGVAIVRRAAFDDVSDVDVLPAHWQRFDQLVEESACSAYEGTSGLIFFTSGSFSDEHDFGGVRAFAGDGIGSGLCQWAHLACCDFCGDCG